jgi:hypothetical protein
MHEAQVSIPSIKKKREEKKAKKIFLLTGGVAPVAECWSSMCKALSSILSIEERRKKKKERTLQS